MADERQPQSFEAVPRHAQRFVDLIRSLSVDEVATPIPGMTWTVGEVAVHVLGVLGRYQPDFMWAPTRSALADMNAEQIAAHRATALDVSAIADEITGAIELLGSVAPFIPLDTMVDFHLGLNVSMAAGWANLIAEFFVHGHDIASATGRPWTIPGDEFEGFWHDLIPAGAGWLRPEARQVDEVYELRFPTGPPVTLWIRDAKITIDDAARPADHVIAALDASALALQFPYCRTIITDPAVALLASRFYEI